MSGDTSYLNVNSQLLDVLGLPGPERDERVNCILGPGGRARRGTTEQLLKEWFLSHSFAQELTPALADQLSNPEARALCKVRAR
jgi:hypothetical protein